jgi:outer membrane lipoprotein-sorting protein
MNKIAKYIILPFLILLVNTTFAQTAEEIIRKADQLMQGSSSKGEFKMEIVRPKWTREISLKSWSKGTEYSLMLITAPARDAGTGFLKREKELWNWQPSIDRVIKMPPSMMMQSWMGSDFTNDDLVKESSIVKDYEHRLAGDTTIGEYDAWKLELIPTEDAAVVWGKIVAYIEKDSFFQLLFKYYDEDGYLINTMALSDIKQIGNRTIPTRLEMIPAENPDQKTVLTYLDMEFDINLDDTFFSIQNLKQLR